MERIEGGKDGEVRTVSLVWNVFYLLTTVKVATLVTFPQIWFL